MMGDPQRWQGNLIGDGIALGILGLNRWPLHVACSDTSGNEPVVAGAIVRHRIVGVRLKEKNLHAVLEVLPSPHVDESGVVDAQLEAASGFVAFLLIPPEEGGMPF